LDNRSSTQNIERVRDIKSKKNNKTTKRSMDISRDRENKYS